MLFMNMSISSTKIRLFSSPKFHLLILSFFIFWSYSNTFQSPFVLDDFHSFIEDPNLYLKNFSIDTLKQLADTKFGTLRVIPLATFALDHYLMNGSIAQYHITNIAIHLLVTFTFFFFIKALLSTPKGEKSLFIIDNRFYIVFATVLWSLNPIQTNAVTYVVQRMTSIATLFYLSSITLYINGRINHKPIKKKLFYIFSVIAAILAFLSKENTATLPFALLLVEFLFISPAGLGSFIKKLKWYHYSVIVILLLTLLPLLETPLNYILKGYDTRHFTLSERLLTESRIILHYISLLMLPLPGRMNLEYDIALSTSFLSPPTTIFSIVVLCLLLFFAFHLRKRIPLLSFGIIWFFLNLLIESSMVPLELAFEHRLYLPSAGFFLALIALLDYGFARLQFRKSRQEINTLFVVGMIILSSCSSLLTTVRNNDWRDSHSIYYDCIKKAPNKPRAYTNLGVVLGREGKHEESIKVSEKAILLGRSKYENHFKTANNIIAAHIKQQKYEDAINQGEKYLRDAPQDTDRAGFAKFMSNLGFAYYKTGRYSEAMTNFAIGFAHENQKSNNYLLARMVNTLLAAYDDEESRKELNLGDYQIAKESAVALRMAPLMMDLRAYDEADKFLEMVKKLAPRNEHYLKYLERYQIETKRNSEQSTLKKINNHEIFQANITYRSMMIISHFILQYYSPLIPFTDIVLGEARSASPQNDPFVSLYYLRWFQKCQKQAKLSTELEISLQNFPDFVPILEFASRFYIISGQYEKAVEICKRILEVYPGHRSWLRYQGIIAKYDGETTIEP